MAIGSFLKSLAAPVISGALGLFGAKSADKANKELQMDFAKNAVQWKVEDARKAGIHPLYALGAPTMSPSVSLGATGQALADMGQDVSRAISVGGNAVDRQIQALQLERAGLENTLLRKQINMVGSPPPSPIGANPVIPGQEQTSFVGPQNQVYKLPPGTSPAQHAQNVAGEGGETLYIPWLLAQTLFGPKGALSDEMINRDLRFVRKWWNERAAVGRARMREWR